MKIASFQSNDIQLTGATVADGDYLRSQGFSLTGGKLRLNQAHYTAWMAAVILSGLGFKLQ